MTIEENEALRLELLLLKWAKIDRHVKSIMHGAVVLIWMCAYLISSRPDFKFRW